MTDIAKPHIAHVKFKMNGRREKIELFHEIMSLCDHDWPWGSMRRRDTAMVCGTCQGYIYLQPMIGEDEMKALAKQINETALIDGHLKLTVKSYNKDCPAIKGEKKEVTA